jgi:hypothetical protein
MSSGMTIVIQEAENAQPRRVVKIVPMRSGGYMVMAPYHQARKGFLAKHPVDYSRIGDTELPLTELTAYTAEDWVKLSVHKDGFVQFSGEDPGTDDGRDALVFKEHDIYYRNCTPDTWNGFVIESFILSFRMWSGCVAQLMISELVWASEASRVVELTLSSALSSCRTSQYF